MMADNQLWHIALTTYYILYWGLPILRLQTWSSNHYVFCNTCNFI